MKARSFRFRLAIFSALVSGVILAAFGIAAWVFVYKNLLESVDSRLRGPAERMARRVHEERDWERFRDGMRFSAREIERDGVIMIMSNMDKSVLFESEESEAMPWRGKIEQFEGFLPTPKMLATAPEPPPRRERPPRPEDGSAPEPRGEALAENGEPRPDGGRDRPRLPGEPRGAQWQPLGEARFFTITAADGRHWRTVTHSNSSVTVFMGMDLADFDAEVRRMRSYFLIALPLGLLAIAAGGWAISRSAVRPLDRIISTTSEMNASDLGRRIPVTGNESREFSKLVQVLNAMMDRLEGSFHQATRFTADASHELKTPIAIMQAEIESALKSCEPDSREEASLLNLAEENQRLKRITQSLLLLSQVDSGKLKLAREDVNFSAEIEGLAEDAELLCAKDRLEFEGKIDRGIHVLADRILLMQAVQNLLSNAIKYNTQDGSGRVTCGLSQKGDEVVLEFFNTGTAIPEEDQPKIFDRFYRVDKARGVAVEGFGLGLNLSLEIVRAHGGTLRLAESGEQGTRMEMRLPKV